MTSTTNTEQSQQPEVPAAATKEITDAQQPSQQETNKDGTEVKSNAETGNASADAGNEKKGDSTGEDKEQPASPVKKPQVHKSDWEQGKVYLYQFERCASLPSTSFHCLKLETFLRMAGINYENVDHKMRYKSSKGDMPFVEINGREICEIDNIIEELSKEFKVELDADLTEDQNVITHAFHSMLENHTCWIIRHWRFKHPQEFLKASGTDIRKTINSKLPQSVLNFMFKLGFKSNIKDLIGHGIGRHDADQVYATGRKDLQALSKQLGEKEYFFGDKPHLLDCEAFSVLAQFIYVPFENYDEFIKNETSNLFKFVERMKERYWKDWETICQATEEESSPKKEGETESKKADEASEEEKKKKEELKKEKEEKKRKEKEERERKKKEEKEEKERKKREAKEKAEKEKAEKEKAEKEKAEKDKAAAEKSDKEKSEKSAEEGKEDQAKSGESEAKTGAEGDKAAGTDKAETKESDAKAGEA